MALPRHMAGPNAGWRRLQLDHLVSGKRVTGNKRYNS